LFKTGLPGCGFDIALGARSGGGGGTGGGVGRERGRENKKTEKSNDQKKNMRETEGKKGNRKSTKQFREKKEQGSLRKDTKDLWGNGKPTNIKGHTRRGDGRVGEVKKKGKEKKKIRRDSGHQKMRAGLTDETEDGPLRNGVGGGGQVGSLQGGATPAKGGKTGATFTRGPWWPSKNKLGGRW